MTATLRRSDVAPRGEPPVAPVRGARLPHVGALDGLRAVSLIAVLLYHGGFGWAKGGFLGVSTFFTLSGFLITSLLLVENHQNGRISLRRFWSARARRLAPRRARGPAPGHRVRAVRGHARPRSPGSAATCCRCSASAPTGGWLCPAGTTAPTCRPSSPVQHVWSLAVEEQFYLCLPLLVVLAAARSSRPQRRLALVRRRARPGLHHGARAVGPGRRQHHVGLLRHPHPGRRAARRRASSPAPSTTSRSGAGGRTSSPCSA